MSEAHQPPKLLVVPERRALFAGAFFPAAFSAAVLSCCFSVTGCQRAADTTPGGTGSQTGWLQICNTTNDCEVGECLCGACSQGCSEDSECQALDSNARCAAVSSVSGCSVAPVERLCVSQSTSVLETPSSGGADGEGAAVDAAETAGEAGAASTNIPAGGNASTTTGGSASGSSAGQGPEPDTTGGRSSTGGSVGTGSGGLDSGGGSSSDTGGEGGASGAEGFPWPELPDARGVVVGYEAWDISGAGCCSRVPGSEPSDYCLPGIESRLAQVIPSSDGVVVGTAFDLQTDNGPVVVSFDSAVPVTIGVMETELVPPERIVDMSPVFWVGGVEGDLPQSFMVLLEMPGYGLSVNHPGEQQPQVYYSADGAEFEPLEVTPLMYAAYMDKPGFIVLGAGPDTIQCQLD